MEFNFVAAQACGICVIILCMLAPQCKLKSSIIALHMSANMLAVLQFYLLGETAGILSAFIAVLRGVVFLLCTRFFKKIPVVFLIGFVIAQFVCVYVGWDGWVTALLLVPALYTYGQWQLDVKVTRITLFFTVVAVGAYSFMVGAYMGALNESIQMVSLCIAFWRYRTKKAGSPVDSSV